MADTPSRTRKLSWSEIAKVTERDSHGKHITYAHAKIVARLTPCRACPSKVPQCAGCPAEGS